MEKVHEIIRCQAKLEEACPEDISKTINGVEVTCAIHEE